MSNFTDDQKASLRDILAQPLLQIALQNALADVLAANSGADTIEGAAMAYKVQEGARNVISTLFASADTKPVVTNTHRRLKPEPPIQ